MKKEVGSIISPVYLAIAHQCNCKTRGEAKGVAAIIHSSYPYADVYRQEGTVRLPGRAVFHGGTTAAGSLQNFSNLKPLVVSLFGQLYPGRPGASYDTEELRLGWMQQALHEMAEGLKKHRAPHVAVPYRMGCGLAGGKWSNYIYLLKEFEYSSGIEVIIVKPRD